jgi:DNA-binding CsgD family transcriptional regulator
LVATRAVADEFQIKLMQDIVDLIYEAALLPDLWPALLSQLGEAHGSKGGLLFAASQAGVRWTGGGPVRELMRQAMEEGWMNPDRNPRPELLVRKAHPAFVTELDLMSEAEAKSVPVLRDFLWPRNYIAAAATYVPGLTGDQLVFTLEGFPSSGSARAAIPSLNLLRPHIRRSVQLSGQVRLERLKGHVECLEAIGVPACVLQGSGKVLLANKKFAAELGISAIDGADRLRLTDKRADALLSRLLAAYAQPSSSGLSIAIRDKRGHRRLVHVLPVRGQAYQLLSGGESLVVFAGTPGRPRLSLDLIRDILDLTPAEARVAERVCYGGLTLEQVADELGVSVNTVKTELRSVFLKAGVTKQPELVKVLLGSASL